MIVLYFIFAGALEVVVTKKRSQKLVIVRFYVCKSKVGLRKTIDE